MKWNLQHLLPRKRRDIGIATAGAEANLRAALAESAAPGEDESYRRLMGVIADDLRLRQPAPPVRAPFAWLPVSSVSAAAAILIALAYTAGVDRGVHIAQNARPPMIAEVPTVTEPVIPHGQYVPPVKPAPPAAAPENTPSVPAAQPAARENTPMNYIGNIALDGLTRDQRDMLAIYVRQAEAGEWPSAARSLERLAASEPDADVAITALQGASEIYRTRLHDNASALEILHRERDAIQSRLAGAPDEHRRADLKERLEAVNANIVEIENAAGH